MDHEKFSESSDVSWIWDHVAMFLTDHLELANILVPNNQ